LLLLLLLLLLLQIASQLYSDPNEIVGVFVPPVCSAFHIDKYGVSRYKYPPPTPCLRISCERLAASAAHWLALVPKLFRRARILTQKTREKSKAARNDFSHGNATRSSPTRAQPREAWRRLAKAEGAISRLLDRSNKLETLARVAKDSLDEERRLRREEQKRHASELQLRV